jgi:hypothetical protein
MEIQSYILMISIFFQPVAEAFATFLLDGITLGKIWPGQLSFIGFSYAATLNSYMARLIKRRTGYLVHTLFGWYISILWNHTVVSHKRKIFQESPKTFTMHGFMGLTIQYSPTDWDFNILEF